MRIFKPTVLAAAISLSATLTACGKNDAEQEPTATEEPAVADESSQDPRKADFIEACKLTMTSPDMKQWQTSWDPRGKALLGEGPSTVHSSWWAADEERQTVIDSKAPPLEVSCSFENDSGDPEIMLSIEARGGLTEADVPFGPGTYPIVPRGTGPDAPKGFWVFPLLYGEAMFEATSGTLTVTRFDDKGMAGSFRFEGKEQLGARALVMEGTFDMPCRGGMLEGKCKAGKAIVD